MAAQLQPELWLLRLRLEPTTAQAEGVGAPAGPCPQLRGGCDLPRATPTFALHPAALPSPRTRRWGRTRRNGGRPCPCARVRASARGMRHYLLCPCHPANHIAHRPHSSALADQDAGIRSTAQEMYCSPPLWIGGGGSFRERLEVCPERIVHCLRRSMRGGVKNCLASRVSRRSLAASAFL